MAGVQLSRAGRLKAGMEEAACPLDSFESLLDPSTSIYNDVKDNHFRFQGHVLIGRLIAQIHQALLSPRNNVDKFSTCCLYPQNDPSKEL